MNLTAFAFEHEVSDALPKAFVLGNAPEFYATSELNASNTE